MRTLLALVIMALACALARPSVPAGENVFPGRGPVLDENPPPLPAQKSFLADFVLPQLLMKNYYAFATKARVERNLNLLENEINWIHQMHLQGRLPVLYDAPIPYWVRMMRAPMMVRIESNSPVLNIISERQEEGSKDKLQINLNTKTVSVDEPQKKSNIPKENKPTNTFAMTPFDSGYFDHKDDHKDDHKNDHKDDHKDDHNISKDSDTSTEKPSPSPIKIIKKEEVFDARQIRQNPNLSKTKTLVAENLDRLRIGVSQSGDSTEQPHHIHVLETATSDPAESLFGIALLAAVGAAVAMALIAFAVGWYTLSKKAKAAAEVEYPAYGVTGPTIDNSGDRKLAQSAHMYHYQHQKQQIIAMERHGMDQRDGSVSDPESEEENEEGDYTVYECPGFATTGDMEVKNPLFQDDLTPATPGKCEVVKPQLQE